MAEYKRSGAKVGRKRISEDVIVFCGLKMPEGLQTKIEGLVKELNSHGFDTNKSEIIRITSQIGMKDQEAVRIALKAERARA